MPNVKPVPDGNPERSKKVMQAMLQMTKLDIRALEQAYGQR
jgi:hypothetical protein